MNRTLQPKFVLVIVFLINCLFLSAQDTTKTKVAETGQSPLSQKQDSLKGLPKVDTAKPVPKPNSLTISVDMRVRTEVRRGYKTIPTLDTLPAVFTNQRTRLNFDFKTKLFDFYASLQDTRVWGQQDPREGQGTSAPTEATTYPIYFFELYAEPHFSDKVSMRIGRQRIVYDNQRLFAENDWRLTANSHDAVRFIYNNKINFTTEFIAAYNQYGENTFTSNYKPNGFVNYKALLAHYLNWKFNKNFVLTTINAADGYQSAKDYRTTFMRLTGGGRLEYSSYNWYLTFAGYYQYGKDSSGKKLSAYYFQPEIKYSGKKLFIRLGMEYMSGQDTTSDKDNSFVPLYGVAHRFMGNLDYFSSFPGDVNNGGLINPYLFFQYQSINKRLTLRQENHLFYSQSNAAFKGKGDLNKYLGYEFDSRINYKVLNNILDIESGFCWASVTQSMIAIKKGAGDTKAFPWWFYLSLRFTPTIGKFTFN